MGNAIVKRFGGMSASMKAIAVAISPYVMLELFVPGGTVLAILLFLHRRKAARAAPAAPAREAEDVEVESSFADRGPGQPFATMGASCMILLIMLTA